MVKAAKCCVPKCGNNKSANPSLTFQGFPKDQERSRKWLQVVGYEDLVHLAPGTLTNSRFVCSKHFSSAQFSKRSKKKLSRSAVPDVFEPHISRLSDDIMRHAFVQTEQTCTESSLVKIDAATMKRLSKFLQ